MEHTCVLQQSILEQFPAQHQHISTSQSRSVSSHTNLQHQLLHRTQSQTQLTQSLSIYLCIFFKIISCQRVSSQQIWFHSCPASILQDRLIPPNSVHKQQQFYLCYFWPNRTTNNPVMSNCEIICRPASGLLSSVTEFGTLRSLTWPVGLKEADKQRMQSCQEVLQFQYDFSSEIDSFQVHLSHPITPIKPIYTSLIV